MLTRSRKSKETNHVENIQCIPDRFDGGEQVNDDDSPVPLLSTSSTPSVSPSQDFFNFQGIAYNSYEEMVDAKRKRNLGKLISSGLLEASAKLRETTKTAPRTGGLRSRKRKDSYTVFQQRKSGRIAGAKADGFYILDERPGRKVTVAIEGKQPPNQNDTMRILSSNEKVNFSASDSSNVFYRRRVNDGEDISLQQAVEHADSRWVNDDAVSKTKKFVRTFVDSSKNTRRPKPIASASLLAQIDSLTVDNVTSVAKVVPERIYAVTFHPSPHKIIAVAGDKKGHIGLWDVDATSSDDTSDSVHLFKPHNGAVANLEWNKEGTKLISLSYDSSIRMFDPQKEVFSDIFAAYDSSPEYKGKLGFGLDTGHRFWTQYFCLDHRNDNCLFLTTSTGSLLHVDFRDKGRITFNHDLSEKKVNTVSLHPNGNVLATCGLDRKVQLWDIRKFHASSKTKKTNPKPFATQMSSKSVNSAFFSPSGKYLLNTTMSDNIDIIANPHLQKNTVEKPTYRIRHNNQTGRWLSTFMARWAPLYADMQEEVFVVGSMQQPRTMEVFNGNGGKLLRGIQGEGLTAVVSRCCFHPFLGPLLVMGGNSSGRVTIAQ